MLVFSYDWCPKNPPLWSYLGLPGEKHAGGHGALPAVDPGFESKETASGKQGSNLCPACRMEQKDFAQA